MKVEELRDRINSLQGIRDSSLNTPLTTKACSLLEKLFTLELQECNNTFESLLEQAKQKGEGMNDRLAD